MTQRRIPKPATIETADAVTDAYDRWRQAEATEQATRRDLIEVLRQAARTHPRPAGGSVDPMEAGVEARPHGGVTEGVDPVTAAAFERAAASFEVVGADGD